MQKAYFLMLMQCHVLEADRFTTLLPGQIQMNLCMFLQFHVFRIFLSLYSSVALTSECNFILTYFSKHIYLILFKAFLAFPGWVLHEAQEFFLSDMQESLLTVNHPINTIGYMLNFCLDIFFSFWSIVIIIYFGLFFMFTLDCSSVTYYEFDWCTEVLLNFCTCTKACVSFLKGFFIWAPLVLGIFEEHFNWYLTN